MYCGWGVSIERFCFMAENYCCDLTAGLVIWIDNYENNSSELG